MTADPRLVAIRRRAVEAMTPPAHLALLRRVEQTHTDDGMLRGSRIVESVAVPALPAVDATQVLAPEGTNFSDLEAYLAALEAAGVNYAPIADPTFTGTVTIPTLAVTGGTSAGDNSADITTVWGHLKHKSSAPSIAVGVALGTGGSVGAVVNFGSDQAGRVTLTAGTTSLTTGTAATVTFATARPNTSFSVILTPSSATAGANAVGVYGVPASTTTFDIRFAAAPGSGNTFTYCYWIVEVTN
jgi:hypothetical protein